MWSIDEITYSNEVVYNLKMFKPEFRLLANVFIFKEDNTCVLPRVGATDIEKGIWKLSTNSDSLLINSQNKMFDGNYKIDFYFEEPDILMMKLSSDSMKLICRKGSWKD